MVMQPPNRIIKASLQCHMKSGPLPHSYNWKIQDEHVNWIKNNYKNFSSFRVFYLKVVYLEVTSKFIIYFLYKLISRRVIIYYK